MTRGVAALWLCCACVVALQADEEAGDTKTETTLKEELKELAKTKMSMQSLSKLAGKIKSMRTEDKQLQHEVYEMAAAMVVGTLFFLCICCCICCRKKADNNKPAGHEYEMVKRDDKAFSYEDEEDGKMENQIDVRVLMHLSASFIANSATL
jgi:hypothetical protein